MASAKEPKVDNECCVFQEKWTDDYFFVEVKGRPVCLVFGETLAVMKNTNLELHYSTKHARLSELAFYTRIVNTSL